MTDSVFIADRILENVQVIAPKLKPFADALMVTTRAVGPIGALYAKPAKRRLDIILAHTPLAQREAHFDTRNVIVSTASAPRFICSQANIRHGAPKERVLSQPRPIGLNLENAGAEPPLEIRDSVFAGDHRLECATHNRNDPAAQPLAQIAPMFEHFREFVPGRRADEIVGARLALLQQESQRSAVVSARQRYNVQGAVFVAGDHVSALLPRGTLHQAPGHRITRLCAGQSAAQPFNFGAVISGAVKPIQARFLKPGDAAFLQRKGILGALNQAPRPDHQPKRYSQHGSAAGAQGEGENGVHPTLPKAKYKGQVDSRTRWKIYIPPRAISYRTARERAHSASGRNNSATQGRVEMRTGPVVWIDRPIIVEPDAGCVKITSRSGDEVRVSRVPRHIAIRLQHELRIVLAESADGAAVVEMRSATG